jgi:hypothetical protein
MKNVTENWSCLILKMLPKWHKSLYYKKLDERLILGRIKSYKDPLKP